MRVAGLTDEIGAIQDRRSALYQSYEDAINKYKSSKDTSSFNTNRKKIDADYKLLTGQISALLAKLKSEGSDVADKVSETQMTAFVTYLDESKLVVWCMCLGKDCPVIYVIIFYLVIVFRMCSWNSYRFTK